MKIRLNLKRFLLLGTVFFAFQGMTQAQGNVGASPVRQCGFDELRNAAEQADPKRKAEREAFENRLSAWIQANPQVRTSNATYVIPTVVHLVQSSSTPTVSDACVLSQIQVLNDDFQALNADTTVVPLEFATIIGNVSVEFCLATKDPQGNATTGINRIVDAANSNHNMGNEAQLKALSYWDATKYFNIWVPESISGGVLGYATFPSSLSSNPAEDGIVISGQYFGSGACAQSPFNLGRTATHEAGHWLGLYHTFEGGCAGNSASDCATQGDRICDTPPTASANFGCPATQNTCTETPVDHNDQTVNYMDYGDDLCLVMFSDEQATRMQGVLGTTRANLVSQSNNAAAGCGCSDLTPCTPVAAFFADNVVICPGQTVQFTDNSRGPATSWTWTFNGGTPFAATSQNPSVTYSTPGVYDVTLQVTNSLGTNTVTMPGYITVTSANPPPVAEGFEAPLSADWQLYNEDNAGTWTITNLAASTGSQSFYMDNWTYDALGTKDAFSSRTIDLSGMGTGWLTFDHAYQRASFRFDTLRVLFSVDCGETYAEVWKKGGVNLASVAGVGIAAGYVPAGAADFKKDSIDLTPYTGTDGFKVKFEARGNRGQNLYIDNINITAAVSIDPSASRPQWAMATAPNPFSGDLSVQVQFPRPAQVRFSVTDVHGKTVFVSENLQFGAGSASFQISESRLAELPAGVYLLRGESSLGNVTERIVKMK